MWSSLDILNFFFYLFWYRYLVEIEICVIEKLFLRIMLRSVAYACDFYYLSESIWRIKKLWEFLWLNNMCWGYFWIGFIFKSWTKYFELKNINQNILIRNTLKWYVKIYLEIFLKSTLEILFLKISFKQFLIFFNRRVYLEILIFLIYFLK